MPSRRGPTNVKRERERARQGRRQEKQRRKEQRQSDREAGIVRTEEPAEGVATGENVDNVGRAETPESSESVATSEPEPTAVA